MGQARNLYTFFNMNTADVISQLLIELEKDPALVNENWERFLPNFKKRTLSKRRVPHKVNDKAKKVYTPFPPPQEKSKVDLQIESGEYFLGKQAKERQVREDRDAKMKDKMEKKRKEKLSEYVPPVEVEVKEKKRKRDDGEVKEKKKKKKAEVETNGEAKDANDGGKPGGRVRY